MAFSSPRTDLAAEWAGRPDEAPDGVVHETFARHGVPVKRVEIRTPEAARFLKRSEGRYLTLEPASFSSPVRDLKAEAAALCEELRALLPEGPVLTVGLGNRSVTPDSLGPEAVERVLVTRHLRGKVPGIEGLRPVSCIAPGVLGQTGIESAEMIRALTGTVRPAAVIAVDALAAADPVRLGKTVQLSDAGICPGSGAANHRAGLTRGTLGVPVIAVGVPMITEMPVGEGSMLVAPKDVDTVVREAARMIGLGINMALQPTLSAEEILAITE
ncbi:MAG: GPR endopeptidase [Oscillospiraceae bacterium]|nr:GPR endopeptidase [Oscillospiraceae bacterium]